MDKKSEDMRFLEARMRDLASDAVRDGFAGGKFLPPEVWGRLAERFRSPLPGGVSLEFLGGYDDAERRLPFFYDSSLGYERETLLSLADIVPMEIRTTSGNPVFHRQILGSLMALGVERETVGDILPFSKGRAIFFTLSPLVPFFGEQLCRVGEESVRCKEILLSQDYAPERTTEELRASVASLRIDCLAAALLHLPREKAQALIRAGLLARNHLVQTDPAAPFREGDRITVRGEGRFDILLADGENCTRSGRIRLTAIHYLD